MFYGEHKIIIKALKTTNNLSSSVREHFRMGVLVPVRPIATELWCADRGSVCLHGLFRISLYGYLPHSTYTVCLLFNPVWINQSQPSPLYFLASCRQSAKCRKALRTVVRPSRRRCRHCHRHRPRVSCVFYISLFLFLFLYFQLLLFSVVFVTVIYVFIYGFSFGRRARRKQSDVYVINQNFQSKEM